MNENVIDELIDNIDWMEISYYHHTPEFINTFAYKLNLNTMIDNNIQISEDILRQYEYKIDFNILVRKQQLSEEFIRDFHYKFNWSDIGKYQNLSMDFIREFIDILDINTLLLNKIKNNDIDAIDNLVQEFYYKIDWHLLISIIIDKCLYSKHIKPDDNIEYYKSFMEKYKDYFHNIFNEDYE